MAPGYHDQEGVPENLRKLLAVAVRTIQWSYAIFWSISSRQPGVLEWGDGYYNGDIKTRKTVQAVEFRADQLGLHRSEQLRELYESLSEGESSPHARRPSAALSPEDLSDTEWYYLVCMSFVFNIGQSLPGRTLANGQPIWLCNSHCADTKVFNRSLLAKSASIQTVVCFPFLGGVIELGTTELVPEDPSLIQHVKTSFLDIPCPIVSIISRSVSRSEEDLAYANLGRESLDADFNPVVGCEVEVCSPNNSSNGIGINQQAEECFMIEGLQEGVSQEQSRQFMDDEIANHVHNSITTSDCISQTLFNPEKVIQENEDCLLGIQEDNQMKLTSLGLKADEIHYETVLSTLLKSSRQLILGPHVRNRNQESCFISWKKGGFMGIQMPQSHTPQRLLKRVLIEVAQMHGDCFLDSREDNGRTDKPWKPKVDDIDSNHVLAERRRREKINERFLVLGSLVPSTCKVDKVSILDNTIEHVKVLKKRVEELESSGEVAKPEARMRRKIWDTVERTFDNCGNDYIGNGKKALINKRKACDIDEIEPEITRVPLKDSYLTDKVTVSVVEKDVLIEIRCPWRESLLLEIMGTMSRLHLDSQSVQSTNTDGILSLTIKSKFKGSPFASVGIIRQAIQRVIQKC